jgi:hypothetical protein
MKFQRVVKNPVELLPFLFTFTYKSLVIPF